MGLAPTTRAFLAKSVLATRTRSAAVCDNFPKRAQSSHVVATVRAIDLTCFSFFCLLSCRHLFRYQSLRIEEGIAIHNRSCTAVTQAIVWVIQFIAITEVCVAAFKVIDT